MNTMLKLSDAQRALLSQASQHEAGLAALPKIPRIAADKVIPSLLGRELLAEIPAPQEHVAPAEDGVPHNLRDAARRVLEAWDNEASGRDGLADAIDALRTALAGKSARRAAQPRPPRLGMKLMRSWPC